MRMQNSKKQGQRKTLTELVNLQESCQVLLPFELVDRVFRSQPQHDPSLQDSNYSEDAEGHLRSFAE